jgi:hypothetical protein
MSSFMQIQCSRNLKEAKEQRKKKHITLALPFTLKSILLRQKKKNYGNSNISPCKNIIFKKSSKRNQNPSTYIITL